MLERTLGTRFVPGTNLRGEVAGANWIYLLPSLELSHILCIGAPSAASLTALARLGRVTIRADRAALAALEPLDQWGTVDAVAPEGARLPLDDAAVDVVALAEAPAALADSVLAAEIKRVLTPEGSVYVALRGPLAWLRRARTLQALRAIAGGGSVYWLTPLAGEVQTAVPLSDRAAMRYFLDRDLFSPTITLQTLKGLRRQARRAGKPAASGEKSGGDASDDGDGAGAVGSSLRARLKGAVFAALDWGARRERTLHRGARPASRHAVLAGQAFQERSAVPRYISDLAAASGVDLSGYGWGLWAAGAYSSRKLLFFLFPPGGQTPAFIVKMVRAPQFNDRLENERRALERLEALGLTSDALPRVAFAGRHADLAIVAETIVEGAPFRSRADWSPEDPALETGIGWLTVLGARTASRDAATPSEAAAALEQLYAQFRAIYRLDDAQQRYLADLIARVAGSAAPFPQVFQHGDPGTWNVLMTPAGQAAFLDWESAEPDGMPLWDLLYFLRSYTVSAAREAGQHDRLNGFASHWLDGSELSPVLIRAVDDYCAQTALDPALIEPLFMTCWLHRALKQATLLPPERLERDGHYATLLRLCIDRRDSPVLRRLFET